MRENLSERNTTSKRVPEIDSLYVYKTRHRAKFTHRHQRGTGYRYTSSKVILQGGEDEIHIYHRTVTIKGVANGLTIVTKNGKFREVQRWFNEQIAEIEKHDGLFEKYKSATASPTELGIKYFY